MNTAIDILSAKAPASALERQEPLKPAPVAANDSGAQPVESAVHQPKAVSPTPNASSKGATSFKLVSGTAPDPASEIPPEPEPPIPANDNGERRFKRLRLATSNGEKVARYLDVDDVTGEVTVGITSEEDFIELWAVKAWEYAALFGRMFRLDLTEIQTEEDEVEQGRKAAAVLYKLAHKYPRLMGWMLSARTMESADMLIALTFFGGKAAVVVDALKERKDQEDTSDD